jgi:hypothetical protein
VGRKCNCEPSTLKHSSPLFTAFPPIRYPATLHASFAQVAEVLPILYLRGLSTGDFRPALKALLGEDAAGLSPTTIARLTAGWEKEYNDFRRCDLSGREWTMIGSAPW